MDITKYLKNKDITITNDDLDIDKLTNDLTKGLVKEEEARKGMINKSELDDLTTKYTALESNYNATVKTLGDTNDRVAKITLEKEMMGAGFKEEHFDEISKLRSSLFVDEKDDKKAISSIKEKYKATYFTEEAPQTKVPNEGGINQNNQNKTTPEPKITRNTRLDQFIIKK